jgi:hypothetical protein
MRDDEPGSKVHLGPDLGDGLMTRRVVPMI